MEAEYLEWLRADTAQRIADGQGFTGVRCDVLIELIENYTPEAT